MASSGRMQGNNVTVSDGGNPGNFFFIDWQVAGQDENGNYSDINWQAYLHYNADDAQLDNGVANLGGANRWSNGGRVYNYRAFFATRDQGIISGSFRIGHDGNGNQNLNVNGGIDIYQSGRSQGNANWALPQLYQGIAFSALSFPNITDVGFQVAVSVDRTADLLEVSLDNGATYPYVFSGAFGSKTVQIGDASNPIASGLTYNVRVRVRRQSNGNKTTSGLSGVATLSQNKFFGMGIGVV